MKLRNWFLPHPETYKKAHLISAEAVLIYVLLFIFVQVGLSIYGNAKPGVLGISASINQKTIVDLTNNQRQKNGLSPLTENTALDQAALAKAKDMFDENYWAHYSPSGKSPWDFINDSGYKFSYAGENLARNFYTSDDVIAAWMASPSHKANIVNSHYQDIGIAVVQGVLQGQQTTLVVQEFGTPVEYLAKTQPQNNTQETIPQTTSPPSGAQVEVAGQQIVGGVVIDPYQVTKSFGSTIIILVAILLLLDLYIIRRRAIHRISSRHLPHLALLGIAASAILSMHPGSIL